MTTEEDLHTQEDEVLRGRRARVLLSDPLLQEALKTMDRAFYQAFMDTSPQDTDTLVRLRLLIKCLQEFQGFLASAITSGQLTSLQVKERIQEEQEQELLERQRLNRYNHQ